jgi:hypothetical protein
MRDLSVSAHAHVGDGPVATFIMLNPSTADAENDDRTISAWIGFAMEWGTEGERQRGN